MLGGRADVAAMLVRDELMSTSEEGLRVDMAEVVKKIWGLSSFSRVPRRRARGHSVDASGGPTYDAIPALPAT